MGSLGKLNVGSVALFRFHKPILPGKLGGACVFSSSAAGNKYETRLKIQTSRDFSYKMPALEITAVGHKETRVVSEQKMDVNAAGAGPKKKSKYKTPRQKRKAQSATTGNAVETQVNVSKPKTNNNTNAKMGAKTTTNPVDSLTAPESTEITQVTTIANTTKDVRHRDGVSVPSAASGGVPEPTPLYLARAAAPPSRLAHPRRILIVMDLNGTLLFRPSQKRPTHFVARSHASRFMEYLLATFPVAVWSSARPQNVHNMVGSLLTPAQRGLCTVVWGRDRFGLSRSDYDSRVQCYKRLTRVWADPDIMRAHPEAAAGGRWDQTNTVLVDDSSEKARSEPHNLLQIPEFGGLGNDLPFVLPQVHDYINELSYQADISRYIRECPFKLDPEYRL